MCLDGIPMCSDLDEEIWQENSPRKDHLVSCVKCHKGTAGPATHWRLCVCFVRIPGKFPSQDISCSLSDCARPFSESIFLNALFWIFVLFVCPLWCHRGPTTLCLSVNWPFPPPPSLVMGPSSQSFSLLPCLCLFPNTCKVRQQY